MQKILLLSIMLFATFFWIPGYGEALQELTIMELVENGSAMEGSEVTLTVEAIGDAMKRGEFVWVNGLDSSGAIGFWIPAAYASKIEIMGNGKYKGDIFRMKGVFHRACQEHGGDMDVHVTGMEKVSSGYLLDQTIPPKRMLSAALLTLVGITVGGIFLKRKNR